MSSKCIHCDATDEELPLQQCPICFKRFCDEHQFLMSGRVFCGSKCAEYFFFADPEEEAEE